MICDKCGVVNYVDAGFCKGCGSKLDSPEESSGTPSDSMLNGKDVISSEDTQPSEIPHHQEQQESKLKSLNKKSIAIVVAGVLLLGGLVGILGATGVIFKKPIVVRETGTWPDITYLTTLTKDPDAFIQSLNIPKATEEHSNLKKSGVSKKGSISFAVDIAELKKGSNYTYDGQPNPVMIVQFEEDGTIGFFTIQYTVPDREIPDRSVFADASSLMRIARLPNGPTGPSEQNAVRTAIGAISSHGADYMNETYMSNYLIDETFTDPESLLQKYSIAPNDLSEKTESYGFGKWEEAYSIGLVNMMDRTVDTNGRVKERVGPIAGAFAGRLFEMNSVLNGGILSVNANDEWMLNFIPDVYYSYSTYGSLIDAKLSCQANRRVIISYTANDKPEAADVSDYGGEGFVEFLSFWTYSSENDPSFIQNHRQTSKINFASIANGAEDAAVEASGKADVAGVYHSEPVNQISNGPSIELTCADYSGSAWKAALDYCVNQLGMDKTEVERELSDKSGPLMEFAESNGYVIMVVHGNGNASFVTAFIMALGDYITPEQFR